MNKKVMLFIFMIGLFSLFNTVNASWLNDDYAYCTNVTINVDGFIYNKDDGKIMAEAINLSSLSPLPYNESMIMSTMPCNEGGDELPSNIVPLNQNASGIVREGLLVIVPNGSVASDITYGLYYNYTKITVKTYTTDLEVTARRVENTYFKDVFKNGLVNETRSKPYDVGGDYGWNYGDSSTYGVDGLVMNGTVKLGIAPTGGAFSLLYNFSLVAVFRTTNNPYYAYHYYFAYSKNKKLWYHTLTGRSSTLFYMAPNGSTSNKVGYWYNASVITTVAGTNVALARGIIGGWGSATTTGSFYIWNNTKNESHKEYNSAVVNAWAGGFTAGTDNIGNQYMNRVWVNGSTDILKIHEANNWWVGLVKNRIMFVLSDTQEKGAGGGGPETCYTIEANRIIIPISCSYSLLTGLFSI